MEILDSLSKVKVLVVGDVMIDRYWWGSVSRISPEAPVPVVRLLNTTAAAGGAANVAVNVATLGATPLMFGMTGTDSEGNHLRDLLRDSGLSIDYLARVPDHQTTVKTRVIANGQQIARLDQETGDGLPDEFESDLLAKLMKEIDTAHAIIVSDYAKGLLSDHLLTQIMAIANKAGRSVLVDPKGKKYGKYTGATMITPNRREAAEACNLDENSPNMVDHAGKQLLDELGFDAVLITQGDAGMTLFRQHYAAVHFHAAAREVYDVTGAGDTVIATLATALGAGASLEAASELANTAAGLVVEQVGTSAVHLTDLRRAIEASS